MSHVRKDIEACDDGSYCLNNSKCVTRRKENKVQYCDCDEDVFDSTLRGQSCEHTSVIVCGFDGSFCANGGECSSLKKQSHHENHKGCDCTDNYRGDFCQYRMDRPKNWPFVDETLPSMGNAAMKLEEEKAKSNGNGVIAVFFIFGALFLVLFAFLYRRRRRVDQMFNVSPESTTRQWWQPHLNVDGEAVEKAGTEETKERKWWGAYSNVDSAHMNADLDLKTDGVVEGVVLSSIQEENRDNPTPFQKTDFGNNIV